MASLAHFHHTAAAEAHRNRKILVRTEQRPRTKEAKKIWGPTGSHKMLAIVTVGINTDRRVRGKICIVR